MKLFDDPVTPPGASPASERVSSPPPGRRAAFWRYLLVILAAKVLLEMFFFVGVARQYGEEDLFVSLALPSKEPGKDYWDSIAHFRIVTNWTKWTGDPSDMYPFRIAALYPNQYFLQAFGQSEVSLTLWTAITGIGTVMLVALLGRSLVDAPTGLFSAAILGLIPGHIIYSARVDTDMPQLFFMGLGALLLVLALKAATTRGQLAWAVSSGLSFGFLYLAKLLPSFLALPWALLIPFLLAAWGDRETLLAPGAKLRQAMTISIGVLGAFGLVFAVENWAYFLLSGHWLLHWRVMKGNAVNIESWRCGKFVTLGFLRLWAPADGWGDLWSHAKMFRDSLFPEGNLGSVYSMPIHGWSAVVFLPSLLVLPFIRIGHRKLALLVILGFVFYYIYQEFFWLYPSTEGGRLNLSFVHKVHRFIFPCYLGISLCVGIALGALARIGRHHALRWRRRLFSGAALGIVLAFGVANYPSTVFFQGVLRGSLADLRQICHDLKTIAPDGARVYIAAGSEPYFRLFQYPGHYEWKYFSDEQPDTIRSGWGVVGGFLGIGLSPEWFIEDYPDWLRPYYQGKGGPPPGWRLVRTTPSSVGPRMPPVRILRIPELTVR